MAQKLKDRPLTPERERLNLYRRGSIPWKLTPNAVLETAKRDLLSKALNADVRRARQNLPVGSQSRKDCGTIRKFIFLPRHVKDATTPVELLRAAIEDREIGMVSERVETLAIYGDRDVLWAALELAEAQ